MIINLITINIFITDIFDLAKVIEIFTGKRIFVGGKNHCQLFCNYIKTVYDINNWIISVSQFY